ncbi:MAG: integrase [Sphingomonas bacterium]|uniref:tyrosine-type recombinase/integrase n=1 Tax=Sphingomonas bacterium TaxID=1895847 RepID=UPI00261EF2D7|nr:tyrosine-type recombinase/integrase [Sphingomonas bacterium]MDB5705505.1 integrase [Sphingomonas bacterium]
MSAASILPALIERFFIQRLMQQRNASPHTIASYRDTFRLLFAFAQARLGKPPSRLDLADLDAPFIGAFLDDLEASRSIGIKTRNLRLTAIRAFLRFVALEEPAYAGQIQRVLAIPGKLHDKREVHFLTRDEINAILAAPDRSSWIGRRDHMLLHLAAQTGLRLSEIVQLERTAVVLGTGAHVRCLGKGRKERCTPLTTQTRRALQAWLKEAGKLGSTKLFPNIHGGALSADAVQRLLSRHVATAARACPSLRRKRVTPHVLRHTAAMELLQAGVDISVIALWLGHESIKTTQVYLHAHLALKEAALAKVKPFNGQKGGRYQPGDRLLAFLDAL